MTDYGGMGGITGGRDLNNEDAPKRQEGYAMTKTDNLVRDFAAALAGKLRRADEKYGHGDGWLSNEWEDKCRRDLFKHIRKGDPLDVAAYCAFMWYHNWSTTGESND